MSKAKSLTISQLTAMISTEHELRQNSQGLMNVQNDYRDLMKHGNELGVIRVGSFPTAEGTGHIIVDGVIRIHAAKAAGLKTLPIEEVEYASEVLALADRLNKNMGRGKDVTLGERNKWVKMLKQQGMAQNEIALAVNLTEASVSRILQGKQGEGNPGAKNKGRTHPDRAARGSKRDKVEVVALNTTDGLYALLADVPGHITALAPELIDRAKVDEMQLHIVTAAIESLKGLQKDLVRILGASRKKAA